MKSFHVLLFAPLFLFHLSLSAQQSMELDAQVPTVTTSRQIASANEPAEFDLSAGQQAASFDDLPEYIATHLPYPELAQRQTIEGEVSILVEISATGKISSTEVLHSLGYGCDEAALALIAEMPKWKPATNYGLPVKSKKILELRFRLQ